MKNSTITESLFTIFGAVTLAGLLIIFLPFLNFWIAYFGGWLASVVIGDKLCNALNTLTGTTHFTKEMLPWCAAALGWIGGYFKTINTNKNK